jgi:Na+/proline symporter
MSLITIFIAVLVGPALYLVITLVGEKPTSYSDYHYGGRTIPLYKFTDSTVMYAVQVAAITLFATWGYDAGFWAIWVPIFWAMGYFAIAYMLNNGLLDTFLKQDKIGTIHQFLSEKGGNFKLLGALAALASLLGIAGPAMFEAQYVGELVARIGTTSLDQNVASDLISKYSPLFFISFLILASIYMLYGGFKAIVNTDVYQLGIGYSGFSIVLSILLVIVAQSGNKFASLLLLIILAISSGALLLYWKNIFKIQNKNDKHILSELPLYIGLLSYSCALLISAFFIKSSGEVFSVNVWSQFIDAHQIFNPLSLGAMGIISLLIANSLYQIVDIGQWQRLASVKLDENEYLNSRERLAKTIRMTGVYSSFTWIVAVFFGMTLKYISGAVSKNPYDAVAIFLVNYSKGNAIEQFVVFLMIVSVVAIMFSTLDSLVSSITFTIHNDWLVSLNEKFRSIAIGRLFTVLFIVLAFFLYDLLSKNVSSFADILYSCWAFQIALFPIVYVAVWKGSIPGRWATISLLGGMYGSLIPILHPGLELSPYEFAPIFSLSISSILMIIGSQLVKTNMEVKNVS